MLILNELSYTDFNKHEFQLLLIVISNRSERFNTIVTTNLLFSRWTDENAVMVSALADIG